MSDEDGSKPPTARTRILGLLERLQFVQLRLAAVALIVMMLITIADVTLRYTLNHPIPGTYELVECMLVVFVFHGISAAFLRRQHIVIDLIDMLVGERVLTMLIRIADLLALLCLLVLIWAMVGPALQAYEYGDRKLELSLPLYVLWAVALVGMAGAILCAFGALLSGRAVGHGGLK